MCLRLSSGGGGVGGYWGQDRSREQGGKSRFQVKPQPCGSPGGKAPSFAGSQGAGLHIPALARARELPALPLQDTGTRGGCPGGAPQAQTQFSELTEHWANWPPGRVAEAEMASQRPPPQWPAPPTLDCPGPLYLGGVGTGSSQRKGHGPQGQGG